VTPKPNVLVIALAAVQALAIGAVAIAGANGSRP
jgi:hypothetical protein